MKTLLRIFFVLPGRIIAYFSYLFPSHGQVWASARRKDNIAAHIIFSILFWLIVAIWCGPIIMGIVGAQNGNANIGRFSTTPVAVESGNTNKNRSIGGSDEFTVPNVADIYLGNANKK